MKTCPVCDTDFSEQRSTCPRDGAVLIESHELVPGSQVRGKYRIVRKLGQGGMGVVYLADDVLLGVQVALKFLAGELGKDPKFIKRFRMEARAAYQLRHPNIVEVTNLDQSEDGSLFIAMDFVDGPSLRAALDEARQGFDVPLALALARGIASGLAAAHAHGTVHRDIKPENILLEPAAGGRQMPKILDFGIVAIAESVTHLSHTHGLLLTADYAAPEQWLETPASQLDGRTDLYALGSVLYEMLTGVTPFHATSTAGWMRQHLDESAKPPSHLRPELADWPGLDALVMRLLAKERDQRPKDVAEVIAMLDAVHHLSAEDQRQKMAGGARRQTEVAAASPPPQRTLHEPPAAEPARSETHEAHSEVPDFLTSMPEANGLPGWAWAALVLLALLAGFAAVRLIAPQLQAVKFNSLFQAAQQWSASAPPQPSTQTKHASAPLADSDPRLIPSPPFDSEPKPVPPAKPPAAQPTAPSKAETASTPSLKPEAKSSLLEPGIALLKQQAVALYGQQRYAEANAPLNVACSSGSWEACKDLGNMYHYGQGVAEDDARAAGFYEKSCTGAPPKACNSLGVMYANGSGVAKDDLRAAALYSTACNAGDAMGCSNLGNIYSSGRGVTRDDQRAAMLYQKSCDAGNAAGCSNLGNFYWFGRGVEKSPARARLLLARGCSMGNQWGCDRLKSLQ